MNVMMCTPVQYRQIALILNSSAQIRSSTNTIPTTTDPSLAQCTIDQGAFQPHREFTTTMNTKNARPSTETGIPMMCDSGLVVTASQLTVLLSAQPAKAVDPLKCWYVR